MAQGGASECGEPAPEIRRFVTDSGLVGAGEDVSFSPLTGGVSSDIWRVATPQRIFCVKRALARLRVAAEWRVPVERSFYEAAWLKGVASRVPGAAPRVLADDPAGGLFAMEYLPPDRFLWWKGALLAGRVDPAIAAALGDRLGRIHAAFAHDREIEARFPTDAIFHSIRLEPYLLATAASHPDLAPALTALAARTAATRHTLVHGDVSPKNILVGPDGPVLLDAECAWYGDPAFDLAFCLNHLLLKVLVAPHAAPALHASFAALAASYRARIDWEDAADLEARAASLLPGLLLARVDGKSPVEYLGDETEKDVVRRVARPLLLAPSSRLADVSAAWAREAGLAPSGDSA